MDIKAHVIRKHWGTHDYRMYTDPTAEIWWIAENNLDLEPGRIRVALVRRNGWFYVPELF